MIFSEGLLSLLRSCRTGDKREELTHLHAFSEVQHSPSRSSTHIAPRYPSGGHIPSKSFSLLPGAHIAVCSKCVHLPRQAFTYCLP